MPDLSGVGRPYHVFQSDLVNLRWRTKRERRPELVVVVAVVVLGSDAGADVALYLMEPVFLHLQVVHHFLEMGVGAGMIGG